MARKKLTERGLAQAKLTTLIEYYLADMQCRDSTQETDRITTFRDRSLPPQLRTKSQRGQQRTNPSPGLWNPSMKRNS